MQLYHMSVYQAALKDADKELQSRYKEMKARAEMAETALRTRVEDKTLHERIADLELRALTATENDARSQKQLKQMYERMKAKEKEMVAMREEIIGVTKQKQDALLKSTNLDSETSDIIKSLQRKVSQMNQERKTLDAVVQELTWKNEEIKQRERRAVLDSEKCYIELSSKVADIVDLEQRLQSLHFAYTLVEKDMIAEQKKHRDQKAHQEAADEALVKTIMKSNKKMKEQQEKQKKLKNQVIQAELKLAASTSSLPEVTPVSQPAKVLKVIKKSPSRGYGANLASQVPVSPPPAPSPLSDFSNAVCHSCMKLCCDRTGARVSDSRMCSVCKLFYCPACKRQNLTRRGPGIYKHPQCVGSKTQYLYPY